MGPGPCFQELVMLCTYVFKGSRQILYLRRAPAVGRKIRHSPSVRRLSTGLTSCVGLRQGPLSASDVRERWVRAEGRTNREGRDLHAAVASNQPKGACNDSSATASRSKTSVDLSLGHTRPDGGRAGACPTS